MTKICLLVADLRFLLRSPTPEGLNVQALGLSLFPPELVLPQYHHAM